MSDLGDRSGARSFSSHGQHHTNVHSDGCNYLPKLDIDACPTQVPKRFWERGEGGMIDKAKRERAAPPLPYRRLSRLTNELHLSALLETRAHLTSDFLGGTVLLTVMRLCADDWTRHGVIAAPNSPRRAASASAIATSLRRPYETVRRQVRALVAAGLCCEVAGGLAIDPAATKVAGAYARLHDIYLGFVQAMAEADVLEARSSRTGAPSLSRVMATALDALLVPFELFADTIGNWQSMPIWLVVTTANVRPITTCPELSERFADASTPDAMRRPTPPRSIERLLGASYGTVWRHCRMLEARGLLTRTRDGWLVRTEQLRAPDVEAAVVASMHYYHRRAAALVHLGLDPHAPPYDKERPPLAVID